jgi:copper(I)-binding protein
VLKVNDAVVTLSPVDNNPSAVHFTVHGGPENVDLVRVFSSSALRAEMHESSVDPATKMMSMQKLEKVAIPAKGKVEFKEGGKHAMFWGINKLARRLGELKIEFTFSNGERIMVEAKVQEIDGSVPDERKEYMG